MKNIGILSDTHINSADDTFLYNCSRAFSKCDIIIHAGDLTDLSILSIFKGKEVHAVSGNMCNNMTQLSLPKEKRIIIDGYSIGVSHGAGNRLNIEDRVFEMFPDVSCIIYGHTHAPVCHTVGKTLFINPGSFQGTGKYGAAGTYAILQIDKNGLSAAIHTLSSL